jgi:hypothetical protein
MDDTLGDFIPAQYRQWQHHTRALILESSGMGTHNSGKRFLLDPSGSYRPADGHQVAPTSWAKPDGRAGPDRAGREE